MHLRSVLSAVFCFCVPAFALLTLCSFDTPFQVSAELKQGVEVVPITDSGTEVVDLADWQFTSCSQSMSGLGNWQYSGGDVRANCDPSDRSATTRPCINIYIVNVGGGCQAFGSRGLAGGGCSSVPVCCGGSTNPVGLGNPNALSGFDIGNLFRDFVASRVQSGGLLGAGFSGNLLGDSDSSSSDESLSTSSDGMTALYAAIAQSMKK